MQVKTYTGKTTTAVLANIKTDLGADAVILDTREVRKNGVAEIVITAAVERGHPVSAGGPSAAPATCHAHAAMGWKTWQEEWASIKTHLLSLVKPELQLARLSPRQRVAMEFLDQEGVGASPLLAVYESLLPDPRASILAPLDELVHVKGWSAGNWPQRVHLIAGPFGSGKTTALIRLALLLRKEVPSSKIWVVNADSLRGGGRLLLKNYAQLCGLEYREAGNTADFFNVLSSARTEGVTSIFVDLPGLPRGRTMTDMLEHFGMADPDNALHLVITPHYGETAMHSLAARYVPDGARHNASVIWTKLDEAEKFGSLINLGAASRLPVSALSCGPELNNTLVPAESAALWRLLFKQEMPCGPHPEAMGF